MAGECKGPVWQKDDFSDCVIFDYFTAIVPLAICACSLCYLLLQLVNAVRHGRRRDGYHPLPQDIVTDPPPTAQGDEESADLDSSDDAEDEQDSLRPDEEAVTLRRIDTHESVIQLDRPRGKLFIVFLEEVAVSLELGAHVAGAVMLKGAGWGSFRYIPQIALWFYISVLTTLRIFLTKQTRFKFSRLWYHTAFIYCLLWPFAALVFRSQIIHPRNTVAWILAIVDFSLVTLLAIIALTSRKGNRDVKLEYEDNIEPSHEQTASLLALVSFSWVDGLIISGYRRTLEITDVWNLAPRDKAAYVLGHYRQAKKTCALAYHLLKYFKRELFIQALWATIGAILAFAPTLLLKAILEYIENPAFIPSNTAWFYVTLLVFFGCIQAVADGQALWIGRQVCIRLRAIIIGEIYAKALKRNSVAKSDKILGARDESSARRGWFKKLFGTKKDEDAEPDKQGDDDAKKDDGSQVSSGTIINLMSVDSFKVSEICAYLHYVVASIPIQFFGTIYLLYRVLGYSSFVGLAVILAFFPLNIWISNKFTRMQKDILAATDSRVDTTNEVLSNIRVIKFFAWEKRFIKKVGEKREREIHFLWMRYLVWSLAALLWSGVPILITFGSFYVYTRVEKKDLLPSVAFTSLSLFMILRVPLDQISDMLASIMASKASVDRVEEYLKEPETEKYNQLNLKFTDDGEPVIGFERATFSWGLKGDAETDSFRLIDLSVHFQPGRFNLIVGPTGAGKTSMLMALLGEMSLLEGNVYLPGSKSREDLKRNPRTGLIESTAYCAQQAWLVNASIKENILFASEFNEKRYNDVLEACALQRDLEIFDGKDETLVGEKGVTLSGGQKQRISLARALYSNSRHLLLDDVLSAVDSHTAKWIFEKAILGPLMNNRSVILITHNVSLALPHADFAVVLDNGRVVARGTPQEVLKSGKLQDDVASSLVISKNHSRAGSTVPSHGDLTALAANGNATEEADGQTKPANKAEVHVQVETKSVGSVSMSVYLIYFAAMGSWIFWLFALSTFVGGQLISVATNVWLREWANAYARKASSTYQLSLPGGVGGGLKLQLPASGMSNVFEAVQFQSPIFANSSVFIDRAPLGFPGASSFGAPAPSFHFGTSPFALSDATLGALSTEEKVDDMYYLGVYALLGVIVMVNTFLRDILIFYGSITASKRIHTRLLESVMHAKFRFFDSTPLGQIMNRFSKDLESVDQQITGSAIGFFYCVLSVLAVVILISVITPGFIVAGLFISIMYFLIGTLYINSSRDLKRLESVNRSPLYQQFGETLVGMTTIRAYCDERRFVRENLNRINVQNRPFIFLWAANRWLAFRVDVVGSLVSFFSGLFVVVNAGKIDPGAAGLSLSYALTYTGNILWLVRLYANNEQNMNAMERIKEYMEVEVEAPQIVEENRPPKSWPSKGAISFINYSTRYRTDFDLVLTKLNFKVLAGEKVGVVGRTGAGKSSMALALFRALEADEGQILVDDVDIAAIGLQDLREKIVMVPQDPTLFSGTIRSNLDPFDLFTNEELFTALRKVQLIDSPGPSSSATPDAPGTPAIGLGRSTRSDGSTLAQSTASALSEATAVGDTLHADNKNVFQNLSSRVAESGSNLSQGQRQLLCLARALLKEPAVLVMDEATASIDHATDGKIQETIRLLRNTTVTIAHRLKTIVDYDKVLVLDRGRVVEFGEPWDLMEREGGMFAGMCQESGDAGALRDIAKRAKAEKAQAS